MSVGLNIFVGDNADNQIVGSNGNDIIFANGGSDTVNGLAGNDTIFAGSGNDQIDAGTGNDIIDAGTGNDIIEGGGGTDIIFAGDGNDIVRGGSDADMIEAGSGDDLVDGGSGNDLLLAGSGDDRVAGGEGDDLVFGGSGNDVLSGGAGSDHIDAGSGDDVATFVIAENAGESDIYDGAEGFDTLKLVFTQDEWLRPEVQADIARFLGSLSGQVLGQAPINTLWCGAYANAAFTFDAFGLTARNFEYLEIVVDGVTYPADQLVDAGDDSFGTIETSFIAGSVLGNDHIPNLIANISLVQGVTAGLLTLNDSGTFTYSTEGAFAHLAEGETAVQTFIYEVTDTDGDKDTATVTLTITGTNDGPVVEAVAGAAAQDHATVSVVLAGFDADSDDDGGTLTYQIVSGPSHGTASITGNVLSFDPGADFQSLAEGETREILITYQATDRHGAVSGTAPIVITVTGSNDGPIASADIAAAAENAGLVSISVLSNDTDIDSDDDAASLRVVSASAASGALIGLSGAPGAGISYDPNSVAAFERLAAGETATDTVTYVIEDSHGAQSSSTVTVTITGSNDGPVILSTGQTGAITEIADSVAGENAGTHAASGEISFADIDAHDHHVATYAPHGEAYRGSFTLAAPGLEGDHVRWNFTIADADLDDLGAGQVLTQAYDVTIDDGHGGTATQTAIITITGANDAPVITAQDLIGAVTELVTPAGLLIDSGSISFSDVDFADTHLVSPTGAPIGTNLGTLSAVLATDTTGGGLGGQVIWTYNIDAAAIDDLRAGETRTESFTITLDDQKGGLITRQIDVTITGTNDAAVVTGQASGSVTEDILTAASGTLTILDPDSGESSFQAQNGIAGSYGQLNINAAGNWTYFLNNGLPAVQALNTGQTLTDSVHVLTADGTPRAIEITIEGRSEGGPATARFTAGADIGITFYNNSTAPTTSDEPYTLSQTVSSFGYDTAFTNTLNNAQMASFLADKEALVFSEMENGGSGSGVATAVGTAVRGFVEGGGTLVMMGSNNGQPLDFLNTTFGFALQNAGSSSQTSALSAADAAGTLFADNAGSLPWNNATYTGVPITSLPEHAKAIYSYTGSNNATVLVAQFGQGQIVYIAYDWFNAAPVGSQDGGWLEVLRDALSYGGNRGSSVNDPIVLDLGGDGVHFTQAGVSFDLNGDGESELLGWAGPQDGVLVIDLDASGAIENGREVLSEFFMGFGYGSSIDALRSLDTNLDGVIDASDIAFDDLLVWTDANTDGISQQGELIGLTAHGIQSININAQEADYQLDGQHVTAEGEVALFSGDIRSYIAVHLQGAHQVDGLATLTEDLALITSAANTLGGTAGDDVLSAFAGNETLLGGAGNDILTGGEGSDLFVFRPGDGVDVIADFAAGGGSDDVIDLLTFDAAMASTAIAHATQLGSDTLIDFGGSQTLTLANVNVADLHENDFAIA